MSLEATLAHSQSAALGRMTSRCTIHRKAAPGARTPGALKTTAWTSVATGIPFRLIRGEGYRSILIGETQTEVANRLGDLPVGTPLLDNDLIEITVGKNAGRVVRVLESIGADQRKSLRVPVVETQRPEEWP